MVEAWHSEHIPISCTPELTNFSKSGGITATGRMQRTFSDAGYWVVSYEGISLKNRQSVLAWDNMIAALRQGDSVDARIYLDNKPTGAGDTNSSAAITLAAALRSSQIEFDVTGIDIIRGDRFSIGTSYYRIQNIISTTATIGVWNPVSGDEIIWNDDIPWYDAISSVNAVVDILPPLRQAVSISDSLEFDSPILRCVPVDMKTGLRKAKYGINSKVSIILREQR